MTARGPEEQWEKMPVPFLGVDGGGTKTAFAIISPNQRIAQLHYDRPHRIRTKSESTMCLLSLKPGLKRSFAGRAYQERYYF